MEWAVADLPGRSPVHVEDGLAASVTDAADRPRGSFPLDPYADARIAAARVASLKANLDSAIAARRDELRRQVMLLLRISLWQPWAEPALEAAEGRDPLLRALTDLSCLCSDALGAGKDILVFGD